MIPIPNSAARPTRILIVDDDPANREVMAIILVHEGFAIATAASGEEALAAVAQQPIDLVLLDVILPGMTGYAVATRMKRDLVTKGIPIIMITAMNDHATRVRALSTGADGFLTKPLARAELCSRVRELLPQPLPMGVA